jgi:hypothetical protein
LKAIVAAARNLLSVLYPHFLLEDTMNRNASLLTGFCFGLVLMYVIDPSQGRRRRALVRDQLRHLYRRTGDRLDGKVRDIANHVSGGINEVYQNAQPDEAADAQIASVRADIDNELDVHARARNIAALQGAPEADAQNRRPSWQG